MSEHLGEGPSGESFLGFLSALGTLVTLTRIWPEANVRMGWWSAVVWRPKWVMDIEKSDDELVEALASELRRSNKAFTELGNLDLTVSSDDFREFARRASLESLSGDRLWADFVAAFGSEVNVGRDGKIQDTALRTMNGGGHQHFLGSMDNLTRSVSEDHIREALFGPWQYQDAGKGQNMRWDDVDLRLHAYRSKAPTKTPIVTVLGANRLAIEALICFPVVPTARRAETIAAYQRKQKVALRWPIWDGLLSLKTVVSLLAHKALLSDPSGHGDSGANNFQYTLRHDSATSLRHLGVREVYESRRVNVERFRNFAPAECIADLRTQDLRGETWESNRQSVEVLPV